MESNNYHEDSSDEADRSDQENNNLGVGRSYECVFCKRGFNTAQALGGHMNIHRKDKARNKPNPNKKEEIYAGPRLYHQILSASSYSSSNSNNNNNNNQFAGGHFLASHHDHRPYAAYYPASSSSTKPLDGNNDYHQQRQNGPDYSDHHPQPTNLPLIPGDWGMSVSLEFTNMNDLEKKEELDLELRLGYDS